MELIEGLRHAGCDMSQMRMSGEVARPSIRLSEINQAGKVWCESMKVLTYEALYPLLKKRVEERKIMLPSDGELPQCRSSRCLGARQRPEEEPGFRCRLRSQCHSFPPV